MNDFIKSNKGILTYSFILLIFIPMFGINFFISFFGNILLILFLIPILLVLFLFIGFNFYKSKINRCNNCGVVSLGLGETCINCGAEINNFSNRDQIVQKPSESTIEVDAEEIK